MDLLPNSPSSASAELRGRKWGDSDQPKTKVARPTKSSDSNATVPRSCRKAFAIAWRAALYANTVPDGAALAAEEEAAGYLDGKYDEQILADYWPQFAALVTERDKRTLAV